MHLFRPGGVINHPSASLGRHSLLKCPLAQYQIRTDSKNTILLALYFDLIDRRSTKENVFARISVTLTWYYSL